MTTPYVPRIPRVSADAEDRVPEGIAGQPVASVTWIPRAQLSGNDYNPNRVAPPEMALLKVSILEDGWTQPIVVHRIAEDAYEVVDGFHRWTVSGDPEVSALTGGLVPCVVLRPVAPEHRRLSTVRHNRARGNHAVMSMADIVTAILDAGVDAEELARRCGTDSGEIKRLRQRGNMRERAPQAAGFSKGWGPATGVSEQTESGA